MPKEAAQQEEVKSEELSEELNEEAQETEVTEEVEKTSEVKEESQEETQPDPDEEVARAKGWRPKEEWEGDPKKWVPADEFNRRGELFDKIENQGRELKETKKVLRMLQEHHMKVKDVEYQRALETLKAQKKKALIDGDADAVIQADEQLLDLKAEEKARAEVGKRTASQPDPRFIAWVEKNSWYAQDQEMRSFADDVGIAHAKAYPDKTPEEVLVYVEQRIRKSYPEKFTNPLRNKPSPTGGRSNESKVSRNEESFELSAEERKAMNTFVAEGIMTKEQYIADIKALRGK